MQDVNLYSGTCQHDKLICFSLCNLIIKGREFLSDGSSQETDIQIDRQTYRERGGERQTCRQREEEEREIQRRT